jgi:HSP20 family protein
MAKSTKSEGKSNLQTAQKSAPARRTTPFDEMEQMFKQFFPQGWMHPMRWEWPAWAQSAGHLESQAPKVDIIERDKEIVVRAETPGVDKKDLDVTVSENSVTIRGSTKEEHREEKGDYYRTEITKGSFTRTVALPCEGNAEKARAEFKDGILELTIPKVTASTRHSVKVE